MAGKKKEKKKIKTNRGICAVGKWDLVKYLAGTFTCVLFHLQLRYKVILELRYPLHENHPSCYISAVESQTPIHLNHNQTSFQHTQSTIHTYLQENSERIPPKKYRFSRLYKHILPQVHTCI